MKKLQSHNIKKKKETIPSTTDARIWAAEWIKIIKKNPAIPLDEECMVGLRIQLWQDMMLQLGK